MSVIEEVLLEEYQRSERITAAIEAEVSSLPRGSIRARSIGSGVYYYLQYRVGDTVKSDYVRADEVDALRERLSRRKYLLVALKEQEQSRKQIERALGKDYIREHSGA